MLFWSNFFLLGNPFHNYCLSSAYTDDNSKQDKYSKLLMLTMASTMKLMWATVNSNPHEFPTHINP